ncbi:MAG: GGDEF domain-containing protein [Gammaproteobacteria bacterium]|nr:MAG: GGDEF domain-containing protein [Gammaproteobacteria bacterium]RLA60925.1 MAG: GGDEF domain-containing protein [Gammaproteobacteria bacterium]
MADDTGRARFDLSGSQNEEIQGAPPVLSRSELRERRLSETVTLNRYLYLQAQQLEHMLLEAADLQALLEVLLVSMPRHFSFQACELWLYDPENVLANLIVGGQRYGQQLQLLHDAFPIQELYDLEPDIVLIDATDSRMFEVLKSEHGIDHALLMPLTDAGRMIGSLHLGLQDDSLVLGEAEEGLVAHLTAIISSCFKSAVSQQQISQLTMLDPLTQISNMRGFEKDIAREISRARRADQPVTVLLMEIDEFDDLYDHYGKRRGEFVVKKVAERISSDLRATDMMARLSRPKFAVLIPGSGEMLGQDIAERMRGDIEDFAIDDGRGAVLQVCISIGLVTWEPKNYPAVDMPQLARQMESVANKALETAKSKGGNRVTQSRLSTLIL